MAYQVYLRRLEVHGFKAFAERQRFEFGNGMSVLVGPNGSGKSNVADAIRWALGEQSSKQIRARKTEDVIFSGSDRRRQMGMAEVTLTLDNSEGWMPIDFAEVSVTRRAHRSGDNEYLINGQQVRLSDVLDLFRRAQVGQNSYAHMSQGLVDEVLTLRPGERRELIEEAADLRRHRHQLTLSERRLVETRDNLGHVRMLIREVEPRLRQLERQSRKAERYQGFASELSEALQVYLEYELRDAREVQTASQATHDQKSRGFAEGQSKMTQLERRLEGLVTALEERRAALETAQQSERRSAEEGLRLEQAVALAEQRLQLIGERSVELEAAVAAAPAEASEPENDETSLAALAATVEQARSELARERAALTAADETTRMILRELGEMEARRARLEAEREDAERRIGEQSRERVRREHERTTASSRFEQLSGELRLYRKRSPERRRTIIRLVNRQRETRAARDAAEAALERAQAEQELSAGALRDAEASLHALEERHALLDQLTESMETAQGGSRAVIEAGQPSDEKSPREPLAGVVDLVSRLIQVPSGLEAAIEAALAEHLSAVVVEREEDAIAAIEYLRSEETGATTVYPLDRLEHVYPVNIFNERGVVGVAARLVKTEQRYRPLVDTLLGRVIVVEDLKVAQQMVRRGLGSVVTRDGVLLRMNGSVYGGKGTSGAEQFGLRRELESLPERRDAAMVLASSARGSADRAERVVTEARAAIVVARDVLDPVDIEARVFEQERARERRVHGQALSDLRSLRSVLDHDERVDEQAQETRTRLDQTEESLTAVAESITTLRDRSTSIATERDEAAARVDEATRTLASRETEHRSETTWRQEREQERHTARERLEQQRTQLATLTREQQDLELSLQDYRQRLANNRSARTKAQEAVGPAHASVAQREEEERELTTSRHDLQRTLLQAEREMLTSETTVREQAQRVTMLLGQVEEENMELLEDGRVIPRIVEAAVAALEDAVDDEVAAAEPAKAVAEAPVQVELPVSIAGSVEVDIPELRERIHELRASIRSLGPVNLEALEDLSEEAERHEFLAGQTDDLEAAEVELRDAIRELRKLIRERFIETFEVVNERFGEYFTRFFGGGQAELRLLQDEDDPESEPGVEIYAQPPGKRVASLNVLSGGERSMTSVALLFSLLAVNPAPMVVLDEVDAALDEANVGRFVDTLKELRERTQFVVISHNRTTIEAGDAIYGVSMGDDSTSQVLSLMVEQATEAVAV
ncbi:MAG: chromosome segregation protein [Chloroflexi bacterium]|nr:MAG: chromosome segregation protein [Chloroflexota bacterium]